MKTQHIWELNDGVISLVTGQKGTIKNIIKSKYFIEFQNNEKE